MNQQQSDLKQDSITKIFNTKILMISSAIFMGLLGITASFFPEDILSSYSIEPGAVSTLFLKVTGALYLGFAVLNWMAKGNLIGAIYSRPVALGNFFHFVLIAITLLKLLITSPPTTLIICGALFYSAFAISFGYILFTGGKSCS